MAVGGEPARRARQRGQRQLGGGIRPPPRTSPPAGPHPRRGAPRRVGDTMPARPVVTPARGAAAVGAQFGVFVPQGWKMDLVGVGDAVAQYEAMTSVARAVDAL